MPDYAQFCREAEITRRQMINAIKTKFPMYEKPTQTMVCNSGDYAVQLLPEAENILVSSFGWHPGLSIQRPKGKRSHANKNKPRRLTVRLSEETFNQTQMLMERLHFATIQDMAEAAIVEFMNRHQGVQE